MTELTRLRILTADSVDELRALAESHPGELWATRFEDLVASHRLELVDSDYEIDEGVTLHLPERSGSRDSFDAQNAYRVLKMLPNLTRADATDERLWVTLCLDRLSEYTHARWVFSPGGKSTLSGHLRNHLFTATMRIRERDHAISRLWWTGDYVRRLVPADDLSSSLHAIYANSEIPVQLLGRPNIATHPSVGRAVISLCRSRFLDDPSQFDRSAFRAFLMDIDMLAGRASLGALDDAEVLELLRSRFDEEFGTAH